MIMMRKKILVVVDPDVEIDNKHGSNEWQLTLKDFWLQLKSSDSNHCEIFGRKICASELK